MRKSFKNKKNKGFIVEIAVGSALLVSVIAAGAIFVAADIGCGIGGFLLGEYLAEKANVKQEKIIEKTQTGEKNEKFK